MIKKTQKAFGLVETLVASTVIIMVVSSLTVISSVTLRSTDRTQQRAQAANLAQEAIETVRQIRDSNWIDQGTTTTNWDSLTCTSAGLINFNLTSKRFCLNTGITESIALNNQTFTRTIVFSDTDDLLDGTDPNNSTKVTVTVNTPSGAVVTVSDVLTNWRPNY